MDVEIRLLGAARVRRGECGDVDAAAWRTAKTFDLLRVLALAGGRPVPVDELLDQFWPYADAGRGGTSLRTATCQIRKVLGHESIARVGSGLVLQGAWVDVQAYRDLAALVTRAREQGRDATVVRLVEAAEALYDGDVDVTGTDCRALHTARADLRRLRVRLLVEAAESAGACAGWRESLELAQRAETIETSDRTTRALMRAWFALGETSRAVEGFERLRRHLADEYGVDPAPQTRALYLRIVSECTEWPPRELTVGREDEVRLVVTAVTRWLMDPDSQSGVVWLVGEPGSGRETVARESARTLMLPLGGSLAEPERQVVLELLSDQCALTRQLAATLRERARAQRRVLLAPVTSTPPGTRDASDAVVEIPPLAPESLREVLTVALQGRPTPELAAELCAESGGLPGRACAQVRHRLQDGSLSWTPEGVDTTLSARRARGSAWLRVRTALAALPVAWAGLVGAESFDPAGERTAQEAPVSPAQWRQHRAGARRTRPGAAGRRACVPA
ncbi:MAG TPA: BTAD domain-containing putative transcriptional regulator [Nocardioides sp.]|uniref:AfsR/SARP family transcriptional regulator n=1 Tax=Nocardioides sp. TaxID=35761 RepID=UPI002BAD2D6C|nr:BTAD domain-containing putative transcriptional regulator [Nocardioides sp.]HTW14057.1 BTAD domain-containing putative transcriptional regulator [Nocardioides sp.]